MTIHDQDGIKAEIDGNDVHITVEGTPTLTLTKDELLDIAMAVVNSVGAFDAAV